MAKGIDLSSLPAPAIVETLDFEVLLEQRKTAFLSRVPAADRDAWAQTLALDSEPVAMLLQESAYRELILRQRVNDAARAVMLAYAVGSDLDHLAALLGVQRLDGEADDRLRARTQLSLEGLSTAGPVRSYEYHALSASSQVADVYVDSPIPGDVRITVLAVPSDDNPGGMAGPALLGRVTEAASAEDVRPLCDNVVAVAAQILTYQVAAALICLPGPDTDVVLAAARLACQRYVADRFRLGQDVTVSGLHAALHQPGVMRVDLSSPAGSLVVENHQAARCISVDVILGGVDA